MTSDLIIKSPKNAKLLYELFEQRSGNNSTIFVGQHPVDEWHERLGDGTQADSIINRIIHNAYEISANKTNSIKIYDTKKLKRIIDEIESKFLLSILKDTLAS